MWLHANARRTHRAAVKNHGRVDPRSICDGSTRPDVSADGWCHCRIARQLQQHVRAVVLAPPGGLLLTLVGAKFVSADHVADEDVHVATSSQQVHRSRRDLQLALRAHRLSQQTATAQCGAKHVGRQVFPKNRYATIGPASVNGPTVGGGREPSVRSWRPPEARQTAPSRPQGRKDMRKVF